MQSDIKPKERPILLNAEMVRAVLDGRKTQTRRIIKNQREGDSWSVKPALEPRHAGHTHDWWLPTGSLPYSALPACPFGAVGDRLWVRETWMPDAPRDGTWADVEFYGCKGSPLSMIPDRYRKPEHCIHLASWDGSEMVGWTPSIHMPRWASRITLEITGVGVERLNSISEEDSASEGVGSAVWFAAKGVPEEKWTSLGEHGAYRASHINSFASLWESIYGADSWQANPWVWVIEFKRVEDEHA